MNEQEKEFAIKIFDCLFRKHEISKLFIFSRYIDSQFGLNCIINKMEYFLCFSASASTFAAATFTVMHEALKIGTNTFRNGLIEVNELSTSISQWPVSLKIAVIEECLRKNTNLYAIPVSDELGVDIKYVNMNIVVVPAAKSLEELAIKMELES